MKITMNVFTDYMVPYNIDVSKKFNEPSTISDVFSFFSFFIDSLFFHKYYISVKSIYCLYVICFLFLTFFVSYLY